MTTVPVCVLKRVACLCESNKLELESGVETCKQADFQTSNCLIYNQDLSEAIILFGKRPHTYTVKFPPLEP